MKGDKNYYSNQVLQYLIFMNGLITQTKKASRYKRQTMTEWSQHTPTGH